MEFANAIARAIDFTNSISSVYIHSVNSIFLNAFEKDLIKKRLNQKKFHCRYFKKIDVKYKNIKYKVGASKF